MCFKRFEEYSVYSPLVLRVVLGAVFIYHGYGKLFGGLGNFQGMLAGLGFPAAGFFALLVALVEFFGGIAVLAGVATRLSASLIAVVMIVAILAVKLAKGWAAMEIDLSLLAMSLSLLFTGPGKFSVEKDMLKKEIFY